MFQNLYRKFWRICVLLSVPLILSPLIIIINTKESKCAYVVIMMVIYWTTEVVELPVTSLLPVILFPLLGLIPTEHICMHYIEDNNMLFIGNLIVAVAAESCNLHRRIALKVLSKFGNNPKWLILGLMLSTGLLAAFISNSASAAMMVPVTDVILNEVITVPREDIPEYRSYTVKTNEVYVLPNSVSKIGIEDNKDLNIRKISHKRKKLRECFYLSVTYAANIGSFATLTGAGPNLVLRFVIEHMYHEKMTIDYENWLIFAFPISFVTIVLSWCVLRILYFGCCGRKDETKDENRMSEVIQQKYRELGPIKSQEIMVSLLFCIMAALWMFRDPHFMKGWSVIFNKIQPDDATISILIAVLLFMIPCKISDPKPCVTWKYVEQNLQWGVVLLRGGGFAVAAAINETGLSKWIGKELSYFHVLPKNIVVTIICLIAAFFTEIISNTASGTIVLSIAAHIALSLGMSPVLMTIPAAMACSFAFMLPVASSSNSIVCSHAGIKAKDMVLSGLIIKFICVAVTLLCVYGYGHYIFDFETLPSTNGTNLSSH